MHKKIISILLMISLMMLVCQPVMATENPVEKQPIVVDRALVDVRSVLSLAHSKLGTPYSWGGNGARGFDCSGFTRYLYDQVGINLPRVAADQFHHGLTVAKDDLQPGDLVFFGYYGSKTIGHVGVYVGGGQFIHSSSRRGVIYTPMNNPYYVQNYKGAKRVIRQVHNTPAESEQPIGI